MAGSQQAENFRQSSSRSRTVTAATVGMAVVLGALNVAVVTFYLLWSATDSWAVDRAEAGGGFDSSMLLPHGDLVWVVATLTLLLLALFDAGCIAFAVIIRRRAMIVGRPVIGIMGSPEGDVA